MSQISSEETNKIDQIKRVLELDPRVLGMYSTFIAEAIYENFDKIKEVIES
jgi:hypothetical protein